MARPSTGVMFPTHKAKASKRRRIRKTLTRMEISK